MKLFRGTFLFAGGLSWIGAALVFGLLLLQHVAPGDGLQFFAPAVSSGKVVIGLMHVVGFASAAGLSLVVGVGMCAHGLVPPPVSQTDVTRMLLGADHFNVRFGEIGRTLDYSDGEGSIEFMFSIESTGIMSLSVPPQTSLPLESARREMAFNRTRRYLQDRGFWVDAEC